MAVARQPLPPGEQQPVVLIGSDPRTDPIWQRNRAAALACAEAALAPKASSGGWGWVALLLGLVGVGVGASR